MLAKLLFLFPTSTQSFELGKFIFLNLIHYKIGCLEFHLRLSLVRPLDLIMLSVSRIFVVTDY